MDSLETLKELSSQMSFEADGETPFGQPRSPRLTPDKPACFSPKESEHAFIHPAQLPNGQKINLLKTLLSSACERDCYYCPFRAGRDFHRATFKPDEFAGLFNKMNRAGMAEGVFLSSGLAGGGVRTQDKILDTAEILRRKYQFRG